MLTNKLSNFCCCWYHKGTNFQANHNDVRNVMDSGGLLLIPQRYEFSSKSQPSIKCSPISSVVADTTKVRIFKQITTSTERTPNAHMLLLIPQRYEFSSKSQLYRCIEWPVQCCCWYHKGTNFQANHNDDLPALKVDKVVADTTKVRIFKQITTPAPTDTKPVELLLIPQRYEFSSKSQLQTWICLLAMVVADTTKVRIFKQITTCFLPHMATRMLLLIPQRYEFSSKSQHHYFGCENGRSCCWYHKGTNFQANHNFLRSILVNNAGCCWYHKGTNFQANHNVTSAQLQLLRLLLIPQRYEFSSKSQPCYVAILWRICCCWYHKGTNFQANHNARWHLLSGRYVVADTTKVRIFKQITTK